MPVRSERAARVVRYADDLVVCALLYHFGTRRLSFLKDPKLLEVVRQLPTSTSVREACVEAGVDPVDMPRYCRALATLVDTQMLTPRGRASQTNGSGQ
jgi:mycofactocin biosynthesis protein MftB